jgi:predicted ferric reductase
VILAASGVGLWHASRATGIVSILLLSAVMVLGILINQKGRLVGLPRFGVTGLHRDLSLLAVVFVVIHVACAIADPTVSIGIAAVVVPFVSSYQAGWIGLGAVAIDLLAAILISSLARQRIGPGTWKAIHWLSYAVWPVAIIHGLGIGTDLSVGWALAATWACVIGVAAALCWRFGTAIRAVPRGQRVAAILASLPAPRSRLDRQQPRTTAAGLEAGQGRTAAHPPPPGEDHEHAARDPQQG